MQLLETILKTIFMAVLALLPFCTTAQESPIPDRPISLIVGYAAGGSVDIVARKYSLKLQELLGQPVVVENRGGASGVIAANFVKNARPDGTTIYFVASPTVSMTPAFTKTAFDPVEDFVPVGSVVKYSNVLLVNANSPLNTVQDLMQFGKDNPQGVTYGSAGVASSNHLSGALLSEKSGIQMVHVPFKGNAPAVLELIAGRITFVFDANNNAINQINAGKVRPLAVTSAARNRQLPNVPTLVESGFEDFTIENWIGLLLPAGSSPEVAQFLTRANQKIVSDPGFIDDMYATGYEMDEVSARQLAERIDTDYRFYSNLASQMQLD